MIACHCSAACPWRGLRWISRTCGLAWRLSVVVWLLTGSTIAHGESVGVVQRAVEVQSGPGSVPPYYVTGRLEPGQRVVILEEVGDFYAIRPPAGSFSYVPKSSVRLVPEHPQVGLVYETVATLMGSLVTREATTEGTRLTSGTLVRILGTDQVAVGGHLIEMYCIEPVGEKRYVRKSAINVREAIVVDQGPPSGIVTPSGPAEVAVLRSQAQAAYERGCATGDFVEAKRLYQMLAQSEQDAVRWEALNRLEFIRLREREWATRPKPAATAQPTSYQPARFGMMPTDKPQGVAVGNNLRIGTASHSSFETGANTRAYGVLRRSTISEQGQPLYYLEDHRGHLRCYLRVADMGGAEQLVGRAVEALGRHLGYRGDLRADLVAVTLLRALE